MSKLIVINPEKCTGCRMCELACSIINEGVFSPNKSRIRVNVFASEAKHIPITCFQCAEAPCVKVCPEEALMQNKELVSFVSEACIGCRMCMQACPFGVISFDIEKGIIAKCDMCGGDPECVMFCAQGALEYTESNLSTKTKERDFARKVAEALES